MAAASAPEQVQAPADSGALRAAMARMIADADEVIRRQAEAPGEVAPRHAAGFFDVCAVMRPRFGPANAWLFQERDHKLRELANRLGAPDVVPAGIDPDELEAFLGRVDSAADQLEAIGLTVQASSTTAGALDWRPARVRGRALRAVDERRTVAGTHPYDSTPAGPTHPALTLHLFPLAVLATSENLVARVQPGVLLAAGDGLLAFALLPQHSGDVDDGATGAAVLERLFGPDSSTALPELAAALAAREAVLRRGVLHVTAEHPRGDSVVPPPAGAQVLQWTHAQGAHAQRAVAPW